MEFLLALQFLTRIPVTVRGNVEEKNLARSMAYYPVVGLLLGILTAAVYIILSQFFSPPVCDLFAVAFTVFITGNMHADALMDTADGFFSGKPKDRILEIMKDSRVGSHGVIAGCLDLLFKFVLLGQIPPDAKLASLVLVPALGRWSLVYGSAVYDYARSGGGTGTFTDLVGRRELAWASVTVITAGLFLLNLPGFILTACAFAGSVLLGRYINKKIGGVTGDTLGAMNECIEVLTLALMPLLLKLNLF